MKIFLYSGTHWDREWYKSFQGFRFMLVGMTNDLIDGLENTPDYGVYHFDGQTVVLDDFLEIEPKKKERLAKLIRDGKIMIGPWYCMPDEFLLSGESLIKNLQRGHRIAREQYGVEPAKNGYICDIFGHIAQMPQIFAGMNLKHTVLGRGTNRHTNSSFFRWQALDGTEITAIRLPDESGYGDFFGFACGNPTSLPEKELDARIKNFFDVIIGNSNIPVAVSFDAQDHIPFRPDTPRYIEALRRVYPDAEVYHTSIDNIDAAVDEYYNELPEKTGELNETTKIDAGYAHLISNTLSSRYPIKKYNDRMQTKLEKWASPLYAFRKTSAPYGFLDLANKFLTQNHPHDSICGCSIDQVHKDMIYRFDQTSLIADEIIGPFTNSLGGDISSSAVTSKTGDTDYKLFRIFNPLPYSYHRMTEAVVRFEGGFKHYAEPFGYESIASFKIYDADENEIPCGIVDINGETYKIAFEADLTAAGVTEFKAVPQSRPSRYTDRLAQTVCSAEGEKIAVSINNDGTINLTDKVTGEVYKNLMTLMDDGEIGDGWFHCNPAIDKIITNNDATIEKVENNCNRVTFRVVQKMMLPKEMKWENGGIHRGCEYEEFSVENFITISRTERYLNIRTVINNNIKDHRLRMRFPTSVEGETYNVNQAFGFVDRRTGTDPGTENWKEFGVVEKQTGGIVAKRNDKRGFAFISAYGIHECGVWENGDMDITMYRSFRKTVGTGGEIGGQLLETLEFSYMLMPFGKEETLAQLQRKQDILQAGYSYATVFGRAAQKYRPAAEFENENFIYSTANVLDDGASEIRIYNASDKTETGKILLPQFAKTAALIEIDGRHIKDLPLADGNVSLTLGKWKIATIMFR